jgi:uncharacterized phage-associated protein
MSVDLSELPDKNVDYEFRRRNALVSTLRKQWQNGAAKPAIESIYRAIADGRTGDALDEMRREFPWLAPPQHEQRVADLLSRGRG